MTEQFLTMKEVIALTTLSRQELWRRRHAGTFPQPVKLGGPRSVRFLRSEIDAWIQARIAERDVQVEARKKALER